MNEYHFSAELAKQYGLDEAVMLHNFAYWIQKNTLDHRNIYDGRAWTYNTQEAFTDWFPWWSRRQIQRILSSLRKQGAILTGDYNTDPMDRTTWYALSDEIIDYYDVPKPVTAGRAEQQEISRPDAQEDVPQSPRKDALQNTEPCCGASETVRIDDLNGATKYNVTKKKHKEKTNTPSDLQSDGAQEARFKQFWKAYPRKEKRKEALRLWMKLNPDEALYRRIMGGLSAYLESPQWRDEKGGFRKQYIPQPTAWLNGERWEDDIITGGAGNRGGPEPPKRIDPGEGFRYV